MFLAYKRMNTFLEYLFDQNRILFDEWKGRFINIQSMGGWRLSQQFDE